VWAAPWPKLFRNKGSESRFPSQGRVPHTPGFPVKLVGVDELHAAFLNESRTRGRWLGPRTGNPGISLVFREMWGTRPWLGNQNCYHQTYVRALCT
jgi:hypothetical protein